MNKIVVAIDSFKGSLSSREADEAAEQGIKTIFPQCEVLHFPVADGGEGILEILTDAFHGHTVPLVAHNPLMQKITTQYGISEDGRTALVEMARISGLPLLPPSRRNPMLTTSYGLGEIIAEALNKGCRHFIIGIGGSATNDGGIGMLQAFGYQFLDKNRKDVGKGVAALGKVEMIIADKVNPLISKIKFQVACDVDNPLYGEKGATYIFGAQKGVTDEMKPLIDNDMKHFADKTKEKLGVSCEDIPGAGAAGGLGFALLSYLNAELTPGAELVMQLTDMEDKIKNSDIVITGEGQLDSQTVMGKAPIGVAGLAKKYDKKVIAFAGIISADAAICNENGIDAFFPIVRGVTTLEEAMKKENAIKNMELAVEQVFRVIVL